VLKDRRVCADRSHNDSTLYNAQEASDLHDVETRLLHTFGEAIGADEIRSCLESAYARYDGVSVRTYVVLLTERRAERELRAIQQVSDQSNEAAHDR
jgi:hypothetical protein